MKILNALLCFCIPFSFFAQNDNYCPCQETQSNYEVLFEWSVQLQEERKPVNLPPVFHQPPPSIMQEPVIVPVALPIDKPEGKPEDEPEQAKESDIDQSRINVAPEKVSASADNGSATRSKIRKKNKLFKRKVKKRKKGKKYKGKCPAF